MRRGDAMPVRGTAQSTLKRALAALCLLVICLLVAIPGQAQEATAPAEQSAEVKQYLQ